jgi:hypothetical protein
LLPAFYSTLAASKNPALAGSIGLSRSISCSIKWLWLNKCLFQPTPLFEEKRLRQNLTFDGVHLNPEGLQLYRATLLKLISTLDLSALY